VENRVKQAGSIRFPLPSWGANLIGFGLLITLVLAAFFWQLTVIDKDLHRNTLDRSRMMAAIIEENLSNAALSQTTIDTVVTSFLRDKARFVQYLNSIDPLQPEELTALARETGLLGISLVTTKDEIIAGPTDWSSAQENCSLPSGQIHYDQEKQTALLIYAEKQENIKCIQIGLDARSIFQLRQKTALPVLLATLSHLPGIQYVRLDRSIAKSEDPVRLISQQGKKTAETRLATPMGTLVVGLDAANHFNRLQQMQRQFLFFAALLLLLGLFFSWLLYRYQQADLLQTRTFERLLAKEHEAAALGRATATIAHEVRNPLNAINMGLQRLTLESPDLDPEQRELISAMEEAVHRADTIITELQRFTRKLQAQMCPIDPVQIIRRLLSLYQAQCTAQHIEMSQNLQWDGRFEADPGLLSELMENLIKNSIEAQPDGGFIHITLSPASKWMHFTITNGGCMLSTKEISRLGEPYFTTKTRGTGLGLALCRKIAEAHGGDLQFQLDPEQQQLTVTVTLPLTAPRHGTVTAGTQPVSQPSKEYHGEHSDR
jgi:signal transduction histidine kinase